jgi:glucose-6-phosphate isomerase
VIDLPGISTAGFDPLRPRFEAALAGLAHDRVVARIWERDPTVWKPRDEEISNRLGWLSAPEQAAESLAEFEGFRRELAGEGFSHALLLGMGGSSLAPEVFSRVFGPGPGGLELRVLDSTDPEAVLAQAESLPWERTIFIVSSKSGTTLETTSFLKYFYVALARRLGEDEVGRHFVAITDPDTRLDDIATALRFRRVFRGDPEIGGRFSALSPFGLLPAALLGRDLGGLVASAVETAAACRNETPEANPGAVLGALLGVSALSGRDQCLLVLSPPIASFGAWIEQLVAESTGKEGRGILPLVRFDAGRVEAFAGRLIAVRIGFADDRTHKGTLARLARAGVPLADLEIPGPESLGGQFFLWEMATAVAGRILEINPFDQPNVAASKKRTEAALKAVRERSGGAEIPTSGTWDPAEFLRLARDAAYVVIQAFLPPTAENALALSGLASRLQRRTGRPVTYDFGPRFLHSTGQLHKGDAGRGLFLQLGARHARDAAVPDATDGEGSTYTFGALIDAQARGDREALGEKGRRALSVRLESLPAGIKAL